MITVKKEGVLLTKRGTGFESEGVLNPATIDDGEFIHLFYRAVSKGNYSSIGYSKLAGPLTVAERKETPVLVREFPYESHGIEDPRIVKLDDLYYLTYTAYDGINALGALAVSSDLVHFEKKGVIVPQVSYLEFSKLIGPHAVINEKYLRYNENGRISEKNDERVLIWDKNVVFFSSRINGKIYFLHRIKPDIQIASVVDLNELTPQFWKAYFQNFDEYIVLTAKYRHEVSYIGSGPPPIETDKGWLLIYHGVRDTIDGYVYSACAALLDLENPQKEIARLPYPLFEPEHRWEMIGEVNNVCFPTGTILHDGTLYIYYGAADEQIACASLNLEALLSELLINSNTHV